MSKMLLSKKQIKFITSLQQKKYRIKYEAFVVEGVKGVNEFLAEAYELDILLVIEDFVEDYAQYKPLEITLEDLKKVSSLKTPNKVLAVFKIPEVTLEKTDGLILALDDINDPGNLGTIIRLCDWFGIGKLVCSENTVDCYNSKVVQATMGSLARIDISYQDLEVFLSSTNKPIYMADMDGENVYSTELPNEAVLVMGNEANGVSNYIKEITQHTLTIPRFGNEQKTESLNVATATAILLSEFKRSIEM